MTWNLVFISLQERNVESLREAKEEVWLFLSV